MNEQIRDLIAENQTEQALELLAKITEDAILLQSRYASGKKQYNLAMLSFQDWSRIQAQINFNALSLLESKSKDV